MPPIGFASFEICTEKKHLFPWPFMYADISSAFLHNLCQRRDRWIAR